MSLKKTLFLLTICICLVKLADALSKFEPPDGYCYHGQYKYWQDDWGRFMNLSGKQTAIAGTYSRWPDFTGSIFHLWNYYRCAIYYSFTGDGDRAPNVTEIKNGLWDNYFIQTANDMKTAGFPIFFGVLPEMNGWWESYWIDDPTYPDQYIQAFRRIVNIFRQYDVDNVAFVFPPNYSSSTGTVWNKKMSAYYPGDEYVDWVGVDGYGRNYDKINHATPDKSFDDIVTSESWYSTYSALGKPLMMAEFGCNTQDPAYYNYHIIGSKADWFTNMFNKLPTTYPKIKALCYFNIKLELSDGDYRIDSDTAPYKDSRAAYAAGIANPRYLSTIGGSYRRFQITPSLSVSKNLLDNSSFEYSEGAVVSDFFKFNPGRWSIDPSVGVHGAKSVINNTYSNHSLEQQLTGIIAGHTYAFSVYAKSNAGTANNFKLTIVFFNNQGNQVDTFSQTKTATTNWNRYSVSRTAPAGTIYASIKIQKTNVSDQLSFDALQFEDGSVVSEYAPKYLVKAGNFFDLTITVTDAYGNRDSNYGGTIHFSADKPGDVLPADYTFTADDAGVHRFKDIGLNTEGGRKIFLTDSNGNKGRSSVIFVGPGSPIDIIPPSIVIISPVNRQTVDVSAVSVSGSAADNTGLSRVEVKVNEGNWQTAIGTTTWSQTVELAAGDNTISARAVDTSGNVRQISILVTSTYFLPEFSTLKSEVVVYPNPYIEGKSGGSKLKFEKLGKQAVINIYTSTGELVNVLNGDSEGRAEWDVREVSAGVYLYMVTSPQGVKKGKVSVIK